ncbi:MAG: DUF1444 family protein [Phycisphaerales bacterium]|nr:DUF1444 family protein [Phycisphaerales bacterium]MCI0630178.1 DUF1444 family protein [Phycisphaerales bacterium]MCI0674881.1 DUF1444 family protein [Phycisphaerales bacterium]
MPREPEAFGEQVAKILQRHFPERSVELAGPMDLVLNGKHLGLENLYRMVQYEPSRGVEIVENYLDRLVEGDTIGSMPLPLSVAKPRIMPRIQPISIFDHLDREQVAHVPFVNDTVIVFVIDMPHMTVSITVEQLMRWGLTAEDLDVIARENLAQYSPQLEIQFVESAEGGRAAIVAAQDGYDAARLLLGTLHKRLAPELHGDFYVATPARDMFLALSCDPKEFVDRLHKRIQLDFKRLPYPITNQLFVVTRDGVAGTTPTREAA